MNLKDFEKKYTLSDLELFNQSISTQKLLFSANKIKQIESSNLSGNCIRLIKNKQIGFAAKYGEANLEELINIALETHIYSQSTSIKFPAADIKSNVSTFNEENYTTETMKETGKEMVDKLLSVDKNILSDISFETTNTVETLKNSKGFDHINKNKIYSISISIRHTSENDFIEIYSGETDNKPINHNKLIEELIFLFKHTKKHSKIKQGIFPILFTSKAAKDLFSIIESALNSKEINSGSSPWTDKLGKKVLDNKLTISQDPSFGFMKRVIDDEGSTIKKFNLVTNGIIENFYFDLNSATKSKISQESTGNGFKSSLAAQPQPSLLNMIISSGSKSRDEIIKNIDYGLLIDQTMGGLSTNISGDISVNVDIGFLIEKGEIIGRVKDTMVSGNIYDSLNSIIEISNSPQWHGTNIFCGDILLDRVY